MASAAVRLEDPSIARIHAVIEVVPKKLFWSTWEPPTRLGDEQVQRSVLSHETASALEIPSSWLNWQGGFRCWDPDVLPESLRNKSLAIG